MDQEEAKLQELETKDAVVSPKYLTASLILLTFSVCLQLYYATQIIRYTYCGIMLIYIGLHTLGIIFILITQVKISKMLVLKRKQTRKMIISSIFLILSSFFLINNCSIGYDVIPRILNPLMRSNWVIGILVVYLLSFILQGIFQLVGHILFRSAMKDISGKTKLVVGLQINIYVLAGLLFGQVIAMTLMANSNLINVSLYVFYGIGIAIPIVFCVFYVVEQIILYQLISRPKTIT